VPKSKTDADANSVVHFARPSSSNIVDTPAPERHHSGFIYAKDDPMIAPILPTYSRAPLTFVSGEGSWLIESQ